MNESVFVGSSPLARGLHDSINYNDPITGIIPARAGFTHLLYTFPRDLWDHPRSRGVYHQRWPELA